MLHNSTRIFFNVYFNNNQSSGRKFGPSKYMTTYPINDKSFYFELIESTSFSF